MATKKKRPIDINSLAASIVADAVSERAPDLVQPKKDPAAVALGRKGGLVGGNARAASLTKKKRAAIAKKAASVRWAKK